MPSAARTAVVKRLLPNSGPRRPSAEVSSAEAPAAASKRTRITRRIADLPAGTPQGRAGTRPAGRNSSPQRGRTGRVEGYIAFSGSPAAVEELILLYG